MSSIRNILLTTAVAFSAMVAAGPVPTAECSTTLSTSTVPATQPTGVSVPDKKPSYLDQVKTCVNPTWPFERVVSEKASKPLNELKQVHPNYYRVYASEPDRADRPYDSMLLQSYDFKSQVETIVEFKNIPANARKCTLHAQIGDANERVFLTHKREDVAHHGESQLVLVETLKGLPKGGKVTYQGIQELRGGIVGNIEFGLWENSDMTGRIFSSWGVPCQSEIYIRMLYNQLCNEKSLYLQQNEKTGFMLRYELDE